MPPPGYEPFLEAIVNAPDDDFPRLIYADWLEEQHDHARAELIRLQCQLASLGYLWIHHPLLPSRSKTNAEVAPLFARHAELWQQHASEWQAEFPVIPGTRLVWGRGFPGWAVIEHPGGMMKFGDALSRVAPVTRLATQGRAATWIREPIEKAAWFRHVRELIIVFPAGETPEGDDIAASLARSSSTAGLRELQLARSDLSDLGIAELAQSTILGQLQRADFSGNRIGNEGAVHLLGNLSDTTLVELNLSQNPILPLYRRRLQERFGRRIRFDT
jgi:uncharacterized protein (TIGR02996 family)